MIYDDNVCDQEILVPKLDLYYVSHSTLNRFIWANSIIKSLTFLLSLNRPQYQWYRRTYLFEALLELCLILVSSISLFGFICWSCILNPSLHPSLASSLLWILLCSCLFIPFSCFIPPSFGKWLNMLLHNYNHPCSSFLYCLRERASVI